MTDGNGGTQGAVRDPETDRARLRAIHAGLTAGNVAAAAKLAEDALADGIDHVMVLSLVAGRREDEGRFDEALNLLRRARRKAPDAPGILNALGLCLLRMGRWDEAIDAFGAALARDPAFAPALANRASALMALARVKQARRDFEAAAALDPANLVAANGLAALALRRGDAAEARRLAGTVLAREPGFPGAVLTLAGADIAQGRAHAAESALRLLIGDVRLDPADRAIATGLLGEALDAQGRFAEAFEAWRESNALQALQHKAPPGGRQSLSGLVRDLGGRLEGKRIAAAWGQSGGGPARHHVFLAGFPGAGIGRVGQLLEAHPDILVSAEAEGLADAARDWMADGERFEAFCDAPDEALDAARAAYWKRIADAGADPAGRVFVDAHGLNAFKLPLIARLFPEARVLFARRDPRDTILSCFRRRFEAADPIHQLLTLEGAAETFAAVIAMAAASEKAFGLYLHPVELEPLIADADGQTKQICDFIGVEWSEALRRGLDAGGVGKWRDYEAQMAPVLPLLEPLAPR